MFYSPSTNGFYDYEINGNSIPADAVEISSNYYVELLEAQSLGKIIIADERGFPISKEIPAPTQEQFALINDAKRRAAYMAETDPLFFKIQRGEATMQEWNQKILEIKNRYPK